MKETLKLVVIGAGSSYTPELIEGIIMHHKELPSAKYGWWILRWEGRSCIRLRN